MRKSDSFRVSSIKNIAISGAVALVSFYALMLVARRFGGSAGSDAYFFLLSLTTFAVGLINPLFATVFLPMFVALKIRSGQDAAADFASTVFSWCVVLTVPIALLAYLGYASFYAVFSRFGADQVHEARNVLIYFAPVFVASVLSEFFRTLVLALGRYTLAAFSSLVQPVFLVVSVAFFSEAWNEEALALSLLASKLVVLGLMAWTVVYRNQLRMAFRLRSDALLGQFVRVSSPYGSANLITVLGSFFFDYVASGLGAGVLTSISYAQRIFILPTALVVNPVLEIARTKFSEAQARQDSQEFALYYRKLVRLVAVISVPLAVFIYGFSTEIIASLFQRGSFDAQSVTIAANCLQVLAFSIPFSCLFMVNGRACESFQRLKLFSFFGALGNVLMILMTAFFIGQWGYLGIPAARLAIDVMYFFPLGFIALHFFDRTLKLAAFWKDAGVAFVAAGLPMAVYWYAGGVERLAPLFPSLPVLIGVFSVYAVVYAAQVWAMTRGSGTVSA